MNPFLAVLSQFSPNPPPSCRVSPHSSLKFSSNPLTIIPKKQITITRNFNLSEKKMMAASWTSSNDNLIGSLFSSPKSSNIELMLNCDLPPPVKVFCGSDKTVLSSMNRVFSMMGREEYNPSEYGDESGGGDEKVGVLKALRLSQTRAREAEKKALELTKERDCVSKALLKESLQVSGYKQCAMVLEVEVMKLKQQWKEQEMVREKKESCEDGNCVVASTWMVALAVCFGVAGVGIAFGYKYLF